jgi:arylformamidase
VNGAITDITRSLGPSSPAWPGDEPFSVRWTQPHGTGAAAVSCLRFSPHVGTHLDAALHLDPAGGDVAALPLGVCVGRCEVVGVNDRVGAITREDLPAGWTPSTPRVLFATGTWPTGAPIPASFASLSPGLVDFLAGAGVVLVGLDTPSVDDPSEAGLPAHRRCVAHGMAILEGLDLTNAAPGTCTLVAAPLRLQGVEASPVRAFLIAESARMTGAG